MNQLGQLISTLLANSDTLVAEEIKGRFGDSGDRRITRRIPMTQAAEMVGVSRPTIYKAHAEGRLVGDVWEGWITSAGLNLYQIDALRDLFDTNPAKECIVEAISGHKGGGYKTTTALHQAQWHAMKGDRVLLVSMDPQGSLNMAMGMLPDVDVKEADTLLPFFRGQQQTAHYAIQKTYFPRLDIIPSCLQLAVVDDEIARANDEGRTALPAHLLLAAALDTVKPLYDLIIIDCPPNLGLSTVMCVFAADVILVPAPVDAFGFYSTRQYLQMLHELLQPFAAHDFTPNLRLLATHYDPANGSDSERFLAKLRRAWGSAMLSTPLKKTNQVPTAYSKMRTIYEQDPAERTSWNAYKKASGIFDELFTEIENTLLKPLWG